MLSPTREMPSRETLRPGSAHRLPAPRLLDQLRERIRYLHYSRSTEDIRTVQELLGHADVDTAMIYTHVLEVGGGAVRSPLDSLPTGEAPQSSRW